MTDKQLAYILEIAKQGNITVAAQKLYISQPSLSNFLAQVEKTAGAKLFDRSLSPMPLTYAGELYIRMAKKIQAAMDEFRQQMDDIRNARTGRLNIGCGPQQSPLILPSIIPALVKSYPGVEYKLTEDSYSALEELLLAGGLDSIFSVGKFKNPAITCIELIKEEMLLFSPKRLHLPNRTGGKNPRLDLQKAGKVPFVLMKQGHQLRMIIDRIFADMGYSPHIILETDNWETCLRMVETGIALTILPNARVHRNIDEGLIRTYRLGGDYYRRIFLCYRKNVCFSKVMSEFTRIALSVFSENNAGTHQPEDSPEEPL